MERKRLCESDFRFMNVVWDHEPVSSMKLVKLCAAELGWKKSTTFTMIRKLCVKGLLRNDHALVTSLIPRSRIQASESELFLKQTFSGSLPGFLGSVLDGKTISREEADLLKRLIDEHGESDGKVGERQAAGTDSVQRGTVQT